MPGRTGQLITALKAACVDPKMGAEVGVQFGKNAVAMLQAFPELTLWLVDCYDDEHPVHHKHPTALVRQTAEIAVLKFPGRVIWAQMLSVEAAKLVKKGELDYAYLDAGHEYEDVKTDIEAWLPKVRTGGVLAGHDYSARFRGVQNAVNGWFGRDNVNRIYSTWWVQV